METTLRSIIATARGPVIPPAGRWTLLPSHPGASRRRGAPRREFTAIHVGRGLLLVLGGLRLHWPARMPGIIARAHRRVGGFRTATPWDQNSLVRQSSYLKAMLPRQPAAALDQFFLENRGPNLRQIRRNSSDRGNSSYVPIPLPAVRIISFQFPLRRYWCETTPGPPARRCTTVPRNEGTPLPSARTASSPLPVAGGRQIRSQSGSIVSIAA